MLDGLPDLFTFVVRLVTANRHRGPLPFFVHYLLEDLANAAEYAANHYFPLTLAEEFLQNTSIGSPYQKWAKFTNEDFEDVVHSLRRLIPALWKLYSIRVPTHGTRTVTPPWNHVLNRT